MSQNGGSRISRRRALLAAIDERLLYRLLDEQVSGSFIQTGLPILSADFSFTLLLDITLDSNPSTGAGRLWKTVAVYNSRLNDKGLYIGKKAASSQSQSCWWNAVEHTLVGTVTGAGRHRYVVRHTANSDELLIDCKFNDENPVSFSFSDTFTPTDINNLMFGSGTNGDYSLPPGMINRAEVYNYILSNDTINAFLS